MFHQTRNAHLHDSAIDDMVERYQSDTFRRRVGKVTDDGDAEGAIVVGSGVRSTTVPTATLVNVTILANKEVVGDISLAWKLQEMCKKIITLFVIVH